MGHFMPYDPFRPPGATHAFRFERDLPYGSVGRQYTIAPPTAPGPAPARVEAPAPQPPNPPLGAFTSAQPLSPGSAPQSYVVPSGLAKGMIVSSTSGVAGVGRPASAPASPGFAQAFQPPAARPEQKKSFG